jgi:glycosyltransferase involved in cell wall biosynthesis
MSKLLLATDAWTPQVNGIVRTLQSTVEQLGRLGCETRVLEPGLFPTFRFPLNPDEDVCLPALSTIRRRMRAYRPDYIHIATEGPLGFATRHVCMRQRLRFTTSFHMYFPERLWYRWRVPPAITYRYFRWFHRPAARVMVSRHGVAATLRARGFTNEFRIWGRGVDTELFHPRPKRMTWERPVQMYVGRISEEKNLDAFLDMPTGGTKVVVGDGPYREKLRKKYRLRSDRVKFTPFVSGEELAQMYAEADVFVFPSTADTYGLVMLEALATGVPVAAHPICSEVLSGVKGTGCLSDDLRTATETALREADPEACVQFVKAHHTWEKCSRQFLGNLHKCR